MTKQQTVDRLSVSLGRKINLGNYESQDVHISYSSDLNEGETIEEATKRLSTVVETIINEKIREIAKSSRSSK